MNYKINKDSVITLTKYELEDIALDMINMALDKTGRCLPESTIQELVNGYLEPKFR